MIKVNYTELDGPYGPAMRLEAAGHAGYAPAGQDIVCAGVSTLMQALVSLLAGEENAHSDAFDEPDGPRLTVTAARPCTAWVEGAFELAKAGFALLAERYPDNVCFADRSARGKQEMMDLQLFADGGEAAAPALSAAQEQQAVASGTMKPGEKADAKQETTAPEGEKEVKETEPVKAEEGQEQEPPRPALPKRFPGSQAVDALHRRWAAEEAMMRRAVPEFSLQKELADPEMRRLMQLPGMRMLDAYRLAHYGDAMRQTARTVEQGVVERIRQRGARPAENGTHPGSAAVTGADVNRMTRSQREALERQALHGAGRQHLLDSCRPVRQRGLPVAALVVDGPGLQARQQLGDQLQLLGVGQPLAGRCEQRQVLQHQAGQRHADGHKAIKRLVSLQSAQDLLEGQLSAAHRAG